MAPSVDAAQPLNAVPYYSQGLREKYRIGEAQLLLSQSTQAFPDISWMPDLEKYLARSSATIRAGVLEKEVPQGWPNFLDSPLAWTGNDFENEDAYIHHLTDEEMADIDKAMVHFKGLGLNGDEVNRERFPLTVLDTYLAQACSEVHTGRGFFVLRGLNPEDYSPEDLTLIFLGVSSYIGVKRGKQDQRGSMLLHVLNRASSANPQELREKLKSKEGQPFHNDTVTDIIGLLTRNCASEGGKSIISSCWTVYNELAATRPDLIHVLAKEDWPFDTFGRDPPYYRRGILYHHDDKIMMSYSRRLLVGHDTEPRSPAIPPLTELQAEALDAIHFIAKSHAIETSMKPGDIRFINNLGVLHCREAYKDDDSHRRHLVRLWCRNEKEAWKLPNALKPAWARVFEDAERDEIWDIEPPTWNGRLLRQAPSCD